MQSDITAVFDLGALRHNLKLIRQAVGNDQDIIACVKANAYGHGAEAVARCLESQGVRWLSVATVADAMTLRQVGTKVRILLFPGVGERPNKLLADAGITVSIQSYQEAEYLARDVGAVTPFFLKIDSGLGRLGASLADAVQIVQRIKSRLPSLKLEGIFTHLPFFDPKDIPWVRARLHEFGTCAASIREILNSPLVIQAIASGGIVFGLEAPEANAVNPGQLLFGLEPPALTTNPDGSSSFGSKPVLSEIRTFLGAIREIPVDTRFGFGGTFMTHRRTRLAVIPAGFSNSFLLPRNGQIANVLGRVVPIVAVSLEHAVLDITDVEGVRDGCPVILLSQDPTHGLALEKVARVQNRSPVEVLVSLTGKCNCRYVESYATPAPASS